MTRLKTTDLQPIPSTLERYEKDLVKKTGCTLLEIARDAAQANLSVRNVLKKTKAAVIPMTSGEGAIQGFSQAVAAVLNRIGVMTMDIKGIDIVGMAEAYEREADLVFVADDKKFVAINTRTRHVVDNATSTAKAYVAALDKMANGLKGRTVLVIGLGNVGSAAVSSLILRKAKPLAVDVDRNKLRAIKDTFGRRIVVSHRLAEAVSRTSLIINAAPAKNILRADMVNENTLISAPAIPIGLTPAAVRKIGNNLVHDPLQLGVAAMAVEACVN